MPTSYNATTIVSSSDMSSSRLSILSCLTCIVLGEQALWQGRRLCETGAELFSAPLHTPDISPRF